MCHAMSPDTVAAPAPDAAVDLPLPAGSRRVATGRWVPGIGKASRVAATEERRRIMRALFGVPLVGTFNVRCAEPLTGLPVFHRGDGLTWHHVRLEHDAGEFTGWAMVQRSDPAILECFTKRRLPEALREGPIRVTALRRWTPAEIEAWARRRRTEDGHRWWQSWTWLPGDLRRGASERVWHHLRDEAWAGAEVLDHGCNEGFFATRAAHAGAVVTAVDKNPLTLAVARAVNDHVEGTDVTFLRGTEPPEGTWDVVVSLSVLHQADPAYEGLDRHVAELRRRARRAVYLELMTPPLSGRLTARQIDSRVGGEKLLTYRHPVRRVRTLYRLPGAAG